MTGLVMATRGGGCGGGGGKAKMAAAAAKEESEQGQMPVLAFLVAALRKSMVSCRPVDESCDDVITAVHQMEMEMEIGWPTNVRHIAHVTFDRFNGFLGLPAEFQREIPGRVPSASASVFGVSAESMQCSYDPKGNSVPTILLLMQERLYSQEGLKAEGIFRINPENSQEEHVRDQLNRGNVPNDIEVHCLAGLIKAWFRELPSGVLDGLSPEQVLECNSEEECVELVKQLKPTETALLNWAIDLMADVVEEEEFNKMNARNIAMVFAPNMTQMSDPLTALMHAVQVMNLLKTLITKTLREREETASGEGGYSPMSSCSSDHQTDEDLYSQHEMDTGSEGNGHYSHHSSEDDEEEPQEDDGHESDLYDHDLDDDLYEVEVLGEVEECFLRQLDDNKAVTTTFVVNDQPSSDLQEQKCVNPQCFSEMSVADSNEEKSGLTSATIDEEEEGEGFDSGKSLVTSLVEEEIKVDDDIEEEMSRAKMEDLKMDRLVERVSHVPLLATE